MGWPTGFEPATTRSTIWGSNQAELRPPADAREANFLYSQRQAPSRAGDQAPNSKLQAPKKHQAPSSKSDLRAVCPGICSWDLGLEIWSVSGAWGLGLGVSL